MRSFLIASAVLLLTVFCVCGNLFFVHARYDRLTELCEKLTPGGGFDENYGALVSLWEDGLPLMALSVPHEKVDAVTEAITLLGVYGRAGGKEYEATKAALLSLFRALRSAEDVSLYNFL